MLLTVKKINTDPIVEGAADPPGVSGEFISTLLCPFWKSMKIPGRFIFHYEEYNTFREIWTDGREIPKDPDPSWNGYSVGRWQGDTLVVGYHGRI